MALAAFGFPKLCHIAWGEVLIAKVNNFLRCIAYDDFIMEAKVAVATVSGKAYYLLVNELKDRGVNFLSLTPNEPIPSTVQVVLTTEEERKFIKHPQVLVYQAKLSASVMVDEAIKLMRGTKAFETITVGVDPGKTFALSANWGQFDGQHAVAAAAQLRLSSDVSLGGAVGMGLSTGKLGTRFGGSWQW